MKKTNKALFQGRIVSMRGDDKNGYITVVCPSIIRTRRGGKFTITARENFPSLSYNGSTETKEISKNFKVGDYVTVKAHMQSYIRQDPRSGETQLNMNAYIDEIEHTESKMEAELGAAGHTYPEGYNNVFLCGEISGLYKRSDTVLSITLDMSDGGRRNSLNLVYFNAPGNVLSRFAIGSPVNIIAELQTTDSSATSTRRTRPYQSLVVMEMTESDQEPDKPVQMSETMVEMMSNAREQLKDIPVIPEVGEEDDGYEEDDNGDTIEYLDDEE